MPVIFDENDLPFCEDYGDHFYSRNDGRAECEHVFIKGNGLPDRWRDSRKFIIGELGFGTGLNFLQTWALWKRARKENQHLTFVSAEAHLMQSQTAEQALTHWPGLALYSIALLAKWNQLGKKIILDEQTSLWVILGKAEETVSSFPMTDAWYLDGFAPAKNPKMWSAELMQSIAERTNANGTFASYTAAGWVRRNLEQAGFTVNKCPGFGTKRHMICGTLR